MDPGKIGRQIKEGNMEVTVQIETKDALIFKLKQGSEPGLCCIEIGTHKDVMQAEIRIEDLKLALKKLTAR